MHWVFKYILSHSLWEGKTDSEFSYMTEAEDYDVGKKLQHFWKMISARCLLIQMYLFVEMVASHVYAWGN